MGQIVPAQDDAEWNKEIERLVEQLSQEDANLPERVIQATEYLLAGWPSYKIARELNIKSSQIKEWLKQYPVMARIVAESRKWLIKWRMSRLEQQFLTAIERSEEILEIGLDGNDTDDNPVNAKVVGVVAQHVRYIIGLYAGQQMDINVNFGIQEETLKATKDALDYIAVRMAQERGGDEAIEATYRVVDESPTSNRPVLDPGGNPHFGEMGVLDTTNLGVLCHICGVREGDLAKHIHMQHKLSDEEYEVTFLLPYGSIKRLKNDG